METWVAILVSACVSALVSFAVSLFVAHGNRRYASYDRLISALAEHN